MKKNYWLDIILLAAGIFCMATGVMLDFHLTPGGRTIRKLIRDIHTYSGYIMLVGICIHIFWHANWLKMTTKKIFKREKKESD